MNLVYRNDYGSSYIDPYTVSSECIHFNIGNIAFLLSHEQIRNLITCVKKSFEPCYCDQCMGGTGSFVYCSMSHVDLRLNVEGRSGQLLFELLQGTLYNLALEKELYDMGISKTQQAL